MLLRFAHAHKQRAKLACTVFEAQSAANSIVWDGERRAVGMRNVVLKESGRFDLVSHQDTSAKRASSSDATSIFSSSR